MNRKQYINWRPVKRKGKAKADKVPVDPVTGHNIDPHDPSNWMTRAEAESHSEYGVGFVFTDADPYFLLDLDHIRDSGGGWSQGALDIVARFPGALVEVSVSGDGLHVIGSYMGEAPRHSKRCLAINGELYTSKRFVAIGTDQRGSPEADCTSALRDLAAQYFPPREQSDVDYVSDGPCEGWTGYADDDKLVRQAIKAKQMFAEVTFADLWNGNEDALAKRWPSDDDAYNRSKADAALAAHLAYWTGRDGPRIERLMRRSALVREKWGRQDYMAWTINLGCSGVEKVYDLNRDAPPPAADETGIRPGAQFLPICEQLKLFAGHIYVVSQNAIMLPDGRVLKQAAYNVAMPSYEFARNTEGEGTARKPWEAITESQAFECPVADELTFEPTEPWDRPIMRGGRAYANTYRPISTPISRGDASPFLGHVERLFPDGHDRAVVLAYMAAVVQFKGVKFQWCPLIQGCEGNGKTLLTTVLFEAIGDRYCHMAQAGDLDNAFNSWLRGKIVIGVDDMHSGAEMIEAIKPMITNKTMGIMAKGANQETSRICCNFIINSNQRDAIAKKENDRRFAVFYTPQQCSDDLTRDGMGGDYFPKLYGWLRGGGYAITHGFLADHDIPESLNPATLCQRAPETSSTRDAIDAGRSPLAAAILDLIAEERPGFCGGWVSRTELAAMRPRESIAKQRAALEELGYIQHPSLPRHGAGCRTNRKVEPEGRKSELWIKRGSPLAQISEAGKVANAYEKRQASTNTPPTERRMAPTS